MWTTVWRTLVLFTLLLVSVRLMGKRQVAQMEPSEFVVTMLLANFATIPLECRDESVLYGAIPIVVVFLAAYLMSYLTLRSIRIRRLFCGKPVILIQDGKILEQNLKRTRVNLDELTMHLREKDIFDLSEVKYAILETNGEVSTLIYAKKRPAVAQEAGITVKETELPITIISDGRLLRDNLTVAKRDETWLERELKKRHCVLQEAFLLTVDTGGNIYFVRKEEA